MSRIFFPFYRLAGSLLLVSLLLSACQAVPTPTLIHIPTVSPALPNTGMTPMVVVNNQSSDGTSVVINEVFSKGPGWIAIHKQNPDGSMGEPIGHEHVQDGDNRNVIVKIDPKQVTGTMYAMLHHDAGQVGVYEFPGPDTPATDANGIIISPPFTWSKGASNAQLPTVIVSSQDANSGVVKITDVISNGPGWIAIHIQNPDGTPGDEIGYTHVNNGDNQNVQVTIDTTKITPVLFAMLHMDAGQIGAYEFPGPDGPQMVGGNMVAPVFYSSLALAAKSTMVMPNMGMTTPANATQTPSVAMAATEPMTETYNTMPASTQTMLPAPTTLPAQTMLPPQTTAPTQTMIPMPAATAAPTAVAPGMIMATAMPGMQPVVEVSDQQVMSGTVTISRVVSNGPGWIVVYTSVNGQPGVPIGYTAVKDGENKNVVVKVDASKATPTLFALLHLDLGQVGKFEFPGPDAPLMLGVQMIQKSFSTQIAAATASPGVQNSMVMINDQVIRDGTVKIAQVYSHGPGWIGIHYQAPDGTIGPPIGDIHVLDGMNKDLIVKINVSQATPVMYAMLHTDAGKIGVWEFPGPDVPVMLNNQMVAPSFKILGGLPRDNTSINLGQSPGLAPFLVDGNGNTLYISFADTPGQSNCDAVCRMKWLPLIVTGRLTAGDGVNVGKLGIIFLADGSRQVTYGGQPLYYYYADNVPGDIGGQGIDGQWFTSPP
jgi:predicted lipoprotein with Yx(FWY)xxD motif